MLATPAYATNKEVLVVLMERPRFGSSGFTTCGFLGQNDPVAPRNSASTWQTVLDQQVTTYYLTESNNAVNWQFKVVANPQPGTNGWWPAQQCSAYSGGNFGPTNLVADAAHRVLNLAHSQGLISAAEIANTRNFIVIDNRQTDQGQSDGVSAYAVTLLLPFIVRPSVVGEGSSNQTGVGVIRHELGNQLGLPELYSGPCPLVEPGGIVATDDCYGGWDMAAFNANGFGVYERMLAGWLSPKATTFEEQSWSGTISVSPLEQPNGDKLALILSTESLLQPGSPLPPSPGPGTWQGYILECRRQIGDDAGLPSGGVLVTYFDSTRGGNAPALAVRTVPQERWRDAILKPGNTYSNSTLGVRVTYTGDAPNGSCVVSVNGRRPHSEDKVITGA